RRAIELEPDDCWAQHAVTHVMEMQARQAEGIAWMEARRDHWAQDDNGFAFHNWWHTALYHLDQGRVDRVIAIYDGSIRPDVWRRGATTGRRTTTDSRSTTGGTPRSITWIRDASIG